MSDRRILFHINSLGIGGAERVVSVLSSEFVSRGYEVMVATEWTSEKEYPLLPSIKRINVGLSKEEEAKGRLFKIVRRYTKLRETVKKEQPDVVISFCNKANFRASQALRGLKTKLVVSVRNDPAKDYAPFKLATGIMENRADGCVFQTEDAAKFFSDKLQKKSRVIFNPLTDKYIRENEFQYDASKHSESKTIVTFGRITYQKNHMLLIKAFERIMDDAPEALLKMYGDVQDPDLNLEIKKYLKEHKLEDRVELLSATDDVISELKKAYMFVLSSDYEGMPNALIEAMAMGIPCISTDCPCGGPRALADSVRADRAGDGVLLVPVSDVDAMSEAMLKLINEPSKADELSKNGRTVRELLAPVRIADEWIDFIQGLK